MTQDNNNNVNNNEPPPPFISSARFTKLILVGVLAGFGLFLQVTAWTLEVLVEEKQEWLEQQEQRRDNQQPMLTKDDLEDALTITADNTNNKNQDASISFRSAASEQYKPITLSTAPEELHQHRRTAAVGQEAASQSNAFYQQAAVTWLSTWDPTVMESYGNEYSSLLSSSSSFVTNDSLNSNTDDDNDDDKKENNNQFTTSSSDSSSSSSPSSASTNSRRRAVVNATLAWHALERAAQLGHPTAQFHVANAYASGIFLGQVQDTWYYQEKGDSSSNKDGDNAKKDRHNNVAESSMTSQQQQQQAWLYWHMAAVGGNVEAALAMASRLEERQRHSNSIRMAGNDANNDDNSPPSSTSASATTIPARCNELLPYYQEAALGIIDALEVDPQSRGKVTPATDKHILYQIHLHGGTPSKLDYHNKADESPEALQFYHLRATSSRTDPRVAASAAYTLGNYYHHGVRGAAQNLTLAAEYYERAAQLNHWEAAGEAGTFYLWGIGVKQDAYQAHKLFRLGMPIGMAGCQRRFQQKLAKSRNADGDDDDDDDDQLSMCDTNSLNGMGLLKLVGLPHVMKANPVEADELFVMARDQGSADAAYNHAMMKLGYAQHWKPLHTLDDEQGQNKVVDEKFPPTGVNLHSPTLGEYQSVLTDLTMAAGKGHMQARLRLGLLFAKGVKVQTTSGSSSSSSSTTTTTTTMTTAINKDCMKAVKQFKWIAENACPFKTKRLRKAYKQYIAGDTQASLLNYLTAAETGSTVGLVNAAFLLEQGECLSTSVPTKKSSRQMPSSVSSSSSPSTAAATVTSLSTSLSSVDCAKASARLWKAAASKGHGEASLRVGDFYYFQRFRELEQSKAGVSGVVGPFGWARYLLYPEESLPILYEKVVEGLQWLRQEYIMTNAGDTTSATVSSSSSSNSAKGARKNDQQHHQSQDQVCQADGDSTLQECSASQLLEDEGKTTSSSSSRVSREEELEHFLESDLEMAAHYYRMAAETTDNARAHFNLGFLYEWGLGLKQDFPLAKRHYDLAASGSSTEAELPVAIALWAMSIHERCLKFYRSWHAYSMDLLYSETILQVIPEDKMNVVLSHILTWESLALLALTAFLVYLVRVAQERQLEQLR
mmetsp:Transcript_21669/g.60143  ORF Transcript_21669/g.60143 Transcript_21669/m.60143 type:complete len:1116 (-) Transcript_21669:1122-4469(-)|eukprot:CAMPEP_0168725302 /NCGR_PEP_ID=MMETSP0724-20121128/4082_1 /TAXON_ID=265536 /ORGANISM="Amphiprora sp., Strain CCMP467" /LENGTH=1115 /DNA_ID=CAMNT_0008772079 /DNA_START=155 /DNA_END=3502 /DNA_ORIENTATION=+